VLPGCSRQYELILVNDASSDRSWSVISEISSQHPWVHGIDLMANVGQHNALLCGIRAATFHTVVTMDDDLQNPPAEIPKLITKLNEGYDVVYGIPDRQEHSLWRNMASRITKKVLQNAMGAEIARNISPFRVFRTRLREAFQHYRGPYVSIDVLLTWGTTNFGAERVRHAPRQEGTSGYNVRSLVSHALNMMTGFSVLPLQLASVIGFSFTMLGLLTLVYVIGRYLIQGNPVPGFPFLASMIAIFSGAQLFALGIIGEYLARIHFRAMEKPAYSVRRTTSHD